MAITWRMLASRRVRARLGPARSTSWTASPWANDGFPAIVSYHGWSSTRTSPGVDANWWISCRPATVLAGFGMR